MGAAITPRADFGSGDPKAPSKAGRDARQTRRLPAPAAICAGAVQGEGTRVGCVGLRIARDKLLRLGAKKSGSGSWSVKSCWPKSRHI